jgi:3-ketosteroid 9alpha-monooxygenase subunit A
MTEASPRFPFPPYANGWYRVAYSAEVAPGELKGLRYFGRELVLFRDESGAAHVLDAHCPHLGAHLAHGGRVEGAGVRCPFHAWLWAGDGTCLEVPYAKRVPPNAKIRAWPTVEKNGLVCLWYDSRERPPAWELPDLLEIGDADWTPLEIRHWTVRSRWLDMNENAVDQAHFEYVHGARSMPSTQAEIDGHVLRCCSRMKLGTPRGEADGGIDTTDFGPAFQTVRLSGIVDTLMMNTTVPIDEDTTDVSFAYTVCTKGDANRARGVGAAIIRDLEHQMAQDIPIWEHKKYWTKPMLCDGDGPIAVYRRWMKQFFDERW